VNRRDRDSAATYKRRFGFHPLVAFVDNGRDGTGEPVAALLCPGNAGSNTASDHIEITGKTLAQLLFATGYRPGTRLLIRTDGAGASRESLNYLHTQRVSYSIGFGLTDTDGLRLTAFVTNSIRGQVQDLELRHRRRARCEDRIRVAQDTGLSNLPLHGFDQNRIWLAIVQLAIDLAAWMQMLGSTDHDARRWEPKRLRLRVFAIVGRTATHARQTCLRLPREAGVVVIRTRHGYPEPTSGARRNRACRSWSSVHLIGFRRRDPCCRTHAILREEPHPCLRLITHSGYRVVGQVNLSPDRAVVSTVPGRPDLQRCARRRLSSEVSDCPRRSSRASPRRDRAAGSTASTSSTSAVIPVNARTTIARSRAVTSSADEPTDLRRVERTMTPPDRKPIRAQNQQPHTDRTHRPHAPTQADAVTRHHRSAPEHFLYCRSISRIPSDYGAGDPPSVRRPDESGWIMGKLEVRELSRKHSRVCTWGTIRAPFVLTYVIRRRCGLRFR